MPYFCTKRMAFSGHAAVEPFSTAPSPAHAPLPGKVPSAPTTDPAPPAPPQPLPCSAPVTTADGLLEDPLAAYPIHVRRCVRRIRAILAERFGDISIRILAFRPADRVSLALMIHDKVVAMNFVSEDECLEAFADDPHQCSSIDRFTHLWAEVIHVKLQDNRSLTQVSRRALAFVPRLTPAV